MIKIVYTCHAIILLKSFTYRKNNICLEVFLMKIKQLLGSLLGIIILFFIFPINISIPAKAVTLDQAYTNAPQGMKLGDYVDIPSSYKKTSGTTTFPSSGKLITDYSTNIIQMITTKSTAKQQIGSFFGNIKNDNGNKTYNYFNLNKPQEISAWIYNGSSDANGTAIDGFAFVLQNDTTNGSSAISRISGTPTAGETLGVWGNASGGGIPNSVALEFDRYLNNSGTAGNNYDNNTYSLPTSGNFSQAIKDKHISWSYPGESSSYTGKSILMHRRTPKSVTNSIPMAGNDVVGAGAPQDYWRHILIKYTPPAAGTTTSTISYKFNDKYPDGTNKLSGLVNSGSFEVDNTKFNSTDGKVYWGFTAATGSALSGISDVAMVIDKMPAIAEVNATVDAHDLTTNRSSSEMGSKTNNQGLTVYNPLDTYDDDEIQFEYNLQYISGLSETGSIQTQIALPEHITYGGDSTGSIGSIIYRDSDGKETKRVNINKSQIEKVTVTIPAATIYDPPTYKTVDGLKLNLDTLKDPNAKIQVLINGVATSPVSNQATITKVDSEHTSYRSDNYSGDIVSPELTISNDKLVIANTNSLNQIVDVGGKAKFTGTFKNALSTPFDGKDLAATIRIYDQNNTLIGIERKENISALLGSTEGKFDLSYDVSDLKVGQAYTAKITLSDQKERISNTLTYNLTLFDKDLVLKEYGSTFDYVERGQDIVLDNDAEYSRGTDAVDLKNVKVYMQIDDGNWVESTLSSEQILSKDRFTMTIPKNTLTLGVHTVNLYIDDGIRKSNVLQRKPNVIEHGIILTPKERNITVSDNSTVNLKWTTKYSSELDANLFKVVNPKKRILQIRNLDQPDMQEFKDFNIYENNSNNSNNSTPIEEFNDNFNFDLNPTALVAKNLRLNLLKEGKNEIKMSVADLTGHYTSAEETVVINVPKLTLQATPEYNDYYSNTKNDVFNMFIKYDYLEDPNYTTDIKNYPVSLVTNIKYQGQTTVTFSSTPSLNSPEDKKLFASGFLNSFPFVKGNDYILELTISDPYNRTSNVTPFTFHYLDKYLALKVDDYNFEDIKYDDPTNGLIKRKDDWKVQVESTGSTWNLYAQSNGLVRGDTLKKDLVFVDNSGNINDLSTKSLIGSRDTKISGQSKIDDITSTWTDNSGIMLRNNKPDISGEYDGTINWDLEDVPE